MYAWLASNLEDSLVCAFQVLELKVHATTSVYLRFFLGKGMGKVIS